MRKSGEIEEEQGGRNMEMAVAALKTTLYLVKFPFVNAPKTMV